MGSLRNRTAAQLAAIAMMLADRQYRSRVRVALIRAAGNEPPERLVASPDANWSSGFGVSP
jgi:Mg-chelatase subunit ChlD